ncbi:MAG TPA: cob(I)yrinic acid a,c-diamide adenosyltransferase [Candidatus Saccharimonadales bacterium]|nr:cob(I)yrinic acid a,c-diamide adenosyltransferase [Candidatus Saccharimonadales bacterium]
MTPKVYTKTGDKGETSLFGGKRVSKASIRVEAYGTVDELNSVIGIIVSDIKISKLQKELINIQNDLFAIGSTLATPKLSDNSLLTKTLTVRTKAHEDLIDALTKQLPELKNFILPGGGKTGAELHVARTICRRAERRIVELAKKEKVNAEILMYFNRLSDLLFTAARYINNQENRKETIWKVMKK